jgi:hypothetical protein
MDDQQRVLAHNPQTGVRAIPGALTAFRRRGVRSGQNPRHATRDSCLHRLQTCKGRAADWAAFPARPGNVLALNGSKLRVAEVTGTQITRIKLTRPRQGVGALSRETPAPNAPTNLHQTQRARADFEHSKTVQAA